MKSLAKSQAILRDVADKLKIRYAGSATIDTVSAANDVNGWPMIILSDAGVVTAGSPVIMLRMISANAVSRDIFGNDLISFAPHALEVAYELTAANNPIPIDTDILIAQFEAIKTGVKIQLKEIANGTAVSETSMNAASPAIELEDLYFPTKGV